MLLTMARKIRLTYYLILNSLCLAVISGCFFKTFDLDSVESYSKHLRRAEEHLRKDEFALAVEDYTAHINSRLEVKRPDWENPYFYYLIIGDLELKQSNVDKALQSYDYAAAKGVDIGLVSDRYRLVANWLAARGEHTQAIDLLNKHRHLDELLFDIMRDRLAREMIALEEKKGL